MYGLSAGTKKKGGRCKEVKIRANVWTVRRDKKKRGGRCKEVKIRANVWTVRREKKKGGPL